MGFFSKFKSAAKGVTRVAVKASLAPTMALSRVAPSPLRKVVGLSPTALLARKALSMTSSRSASAPLDSPGWMPPARGVPRPTGGLFARLSNAITQPTASPSSGQMLAPKFAQAAFPAGTSAPAGWPSASAGGGGGGGDDEGYDAGDDGAEDDGGEEEVAGLGEIDYEQALAGIEGWQDDLKNFGVTAGKTVASQALTTVASKLAGGNKSYTPPPPPPAMSTATKIAIGAAIAVPVGYLLLRRHPAAT